MARIVSIENKYATLEDGAVLQVTEIGQNLNFTIHRSKPLPPVGILLDPNAYFAPWSVNMLFLSRLGYCLIIKEDNIDRDQFGILNKLHILEPGAYAFIAWGATQDDLVVLCSKPTFAEVPYTSSNKVLDSYQKVDIFLPGFMANTGKKLKAKVRLLSRVNLMDQLAEQEKQIDLITKILIAVVMKVTTAGERPAWWPRFRSVMEATDSTSAKGVDAALDDIEARKQLIRQIIADYYQDQR